MKILVTGSTGQVGYEIVKLLSATHLVLNPTRGELDLADLKAVDEYLNKHRPDLIINCAAWTNVDGAESSEIECFNVNRDLPIVLAKYSATNNCWLLHFSTDYVYPGTGEVAWRETDEAAPVNVYGRSKLAGEQAIADITDKFVIMRTSWVYSYRGKNFLLTMLRLGKERAELGIIADQIGAPSSALFLAKHCVAIVDKVLQDSFEAGVYNMCPQGVTSWHGFASAIFTSLPDNKFHEFAISKGNIKAIDTTQYPTPAARPLNSRMCLKKLESALGYSLETWDEALKPVIKILYK